MRTVVLLPDSVSRYLSKVFNRQWLDEKNVEENWGEMSLNAEVEYLSESTPVVGVI